MPTLILLALHEVITSWVRRLSAINTTTLILIYLVAYAVLVAAWLLRIPVLEAPGTWMFGDHR